MELTNLNSATNTYYKNWPWKLKPLIHPSRKWYVQDILQLISVHNPDRKLQHRICSKLHISFKNSIKMWYIPMTYGAASAKEVPYGQTLEIIDNRSLWLDWSQILTVKIYLYSDRYIRQISQAFRQLLVVNNYILLITP